MVGVAVRFQYDPTVLTCFRDQLFNNDDIFKYDLNMCQLGKTRVPCLTKRFGMVLRERRSAETLCVDGMYRTDNFNMNLYLMRSMADTSVHAKGFGDRRRASQATTFALSKYNTTRCPGHFAANRSMATNAANNSSQVISTREKADHPSQLRK